MNDMALAGWRTTPSRPIPPAFRPVSYLFAVVLERSADLPCSHRVLFTTPEVFQPCSISPALENLVEQFARLPGVGVKSAQRLAFHVLSLPEEDAAAFAQAILSAKSAIHCCPVCQNLTEGDGPCSICASPKRDASVICVVADPKDVVAMERAPGSTRGSTTCSTG